MINTKFFFLQVYAESAYILQSLATIASSLEMKDSMLLSSLNISLPANSSMETVMDEAYTYGRGWISTTLRNTLENTDTEVLQELENKVYIREHGYRGSTGTREQGIY